MRSAPALLVIGIGQVALAALYPRAAWLLVWSGLSFCAVAAAYAFQKPRVFGKRPEGTLAWGPCLLLAVPAAHLTDLVLPDALYAGGRLRRSRAGALAGTPRGGLGTSSKRDADCGPDFGVWRATRLADGPCVPLPANVPLPADAGQCGSRAGGVQGRCPESRCLGGRGLRSLCAGARTLRPSRRRRPHGARIGRWPGRSALAGQAGAARRQA